MKLTYLIIFSWLWGTPASPVRMSSWDECVKAAQTYVSNGPGSRAIDKSRSRRAVCVSNNGDLEEF